MSLYTMKLSDSVDTMEFNLLEVPIQDKDIEGAVDNVVLSGDIYTDFLWLKKRFTHKWSILCKDDYERLRGFYTRQFSNAEVPIYQLLDAPSPVEESAGSGEYIQITTTDSTAKLASVEMLGNATQQTYSGTNLMPLEPYRFGYYYGTSVGTQVEYDITSAASQVSFTPRADGTSTMVVSASWRGTYFMSQALTAGTYYLNLNGATTTGNLGASVYAMDSDHKITRQILNTTATPITNQLQMAITLAEGETYISVGIGVRTTAGTNTLGTLMLSAGSTATAYEPYVGGTASPNPDYPQPISVVTGENVVKIEGKNLINPTTMADGYISASGGTYSETNSKYTEFIKAEPNTTYTLSIASGGASQRLCIAQYTSADASTFISRTNVQTTTASLTTSASCQFIRCSINTALATPNYQLELGSTATAYEPYQGQEFEVNLGKNLLPMIDGTATIRGITATIADGILTLNGTSTGSGIFKLTNGVEGSESLAPSASWLTENFPITNLNGTNIAMDYQSGTSPQASSAFRIYGSTSTYINQWYPLTSDQATTWTSDTQAPSCLCFFFGNGITFNNYKITLQIERGSQPTSYSAYFTPIELAKIGNYQDRIYKDEGKWYIEKQVGKVVLDGTEDGWGWADTARYTIATANIGAREAISDHFTYVNYTGHATTASPSFDISSNLASIGFHDKDITSLNNFKTWLSTHNTIVYYALATPTTTEITNEALIAQLEALGASSLYLGVNNIGTETLNAMPTLALTYFPYYPHEIISPKAVRMELTDGGIINACECRENVQITLRETIQ